MVLNWLLNSMIPELAEAFLYVILKNYGLSLLKGLEIVMDHCYINKKRRYWNYIKEMAVWLCIPPN